VDASKPGIVEVRQGKESTMVQVERPSAQSEDVHIFRGTEEPSKEIECVLIYDEETNTFTLEKLDSSLILKHDGKGPSKARIPSASPHPNTPSPAASTSKIDPEEEVERELLNALGGTDTRSKKPKPKPPLPSIDVDEFEEILEQAIIPSKPTLTPPAAKPKKAPTTTKSKGKSKAPAAPPPPLAQGTTSTPLPLTLTPTTAPTKRKPLLKGSAAASTSSTPPPPPKVVPLPGKATPASTPKVALPKPKLAPEPFVATVEVEELEFGSQTRTRSVAPASASSPTGGLALPFSGGSAAFMPGPPPASRSAAAPVVVVDDDDDDDEWDVVVSADPVVAPPVSAAAEIPLDASSFGAVEPTGDIDQFAADLDQQLLEGLEGLEEDDGDGDGDGDGDDDMFGDEAYAQATASVAPKGKPMSLNQFAADIGLEDQDEDDYSSSDESDEE